MRPTVRALVSAAVGVVAGRATRHAVSVYEHEFAATQLAPDDPVLVTLQRMYGPDLVTDYAVVVRLARSDTGRPFTQMRWWADRTLLRGMARDLSIQADRGRV